MGARLNRTVRESGENPSRLLEWKPWSNYCYLVVCTDRGEAFIKVGITDDPDRRLNELRTGCPFTVRDRYLCQAPSRESAFGLEQDILRRYSGLQTNGEWLRMPEASVAGFVQLCSVRATKKFGEPSIFRWVFPRRRYTPGFVRRKRKDRREKRQ